MSGVFAQPRRSPLFARTASAPQPPGGTTDVVMVVSWAPAPLGGLLVGVRKWSTPGSPVWQLVTTSTGSVGNPGLIFEPCTSAIAVAEPGHCASGSMGMGTLDSTVPRPARAGSGNATSTSPVMRPIATAWLKRLVLPTIFL